MDNRLENMEKEWDERAKRLGKTKRSVLFKRMPGFINEYIHRSHLKFINHNISSQARFVLDVGCGYGRISSELKRKKSWLEFQGIDLSEEFSSAFQENVGPCHHGTVSTFEPSQNYDVILIVTLFMYLAPDEQVSTLKRLWTWLQQGGCVICIEPAVEIQQLWRRITRTESASPTGGQVHTYSRAALEALFQPLPGAEIQAVSSVNLIPFLSATALHHALAVSKAS